jgi:hypothetical protein
MDVVVKAQKLLPYYLETPLAQQANMFRHFLNMGQKEWEHRLFLSTE